MPPVLLPVSISGRCSSGSRGKNPGGCSREGKPIHRSFRPRPPGIRGSAGEYPQKSRLGEMNRSCLLPASPHTPDLGGHRQGEGAGEGPPSPLRRTTWSFPQGSRAGAGGSRGEGLGGARTERPAPITSSISIPPYTGSWGLSPRERISSPAETHKIPRKKSE